jgi:hypothetical protein
MNSKKWYASKTIWVNVITLIPLIVDKLGPQVIPAEYAAIVLAVVNVVLRLITTSAVTK